MTFFGVELLWELDGWIIAAAALSALSCALLGNYLVLRRMSMMGDAISHAVLPGLAVAFLLTGSRESLPMLIGAGVIGVLTAVLTQWICDLGRVEHSASMGVVFTTLFALGLILIVRAADRVDLDPGCVLYGAVETMTPIGQDVVRLAGLEVPRPILLLAGIFALNSLFVACFYKELKLSSFDPDLATTLGIPSGVMHYALMTLVAATTVACFESVGSILVIAMLIVPPATAYLLTDRLGRMIALSLLLALLAAVGGHLSAITVPRLWGFESTTTAPMMAVVAGLFFTLALLLSPRHGIVSKLVHRWRLGHDIVCQDVLGLVFRLEEAHIPARLTVLDEAIAAGRTATRLALWELTRRRQLRAAGAAWELTEQGRQAARRLVRSHRLWEAWLHKHLGVDPTRLHQSAERLEHITGPDLQARLAAGADEPTHDPHRREIPGA